MHRKARKLAAAITAVGLIVFGAWLAVDYSTAPRLVVGPMVQMLRPSSFIVVWRVHPDRPAAMNVTAPDGSVLTVQATRQDGQWIAQIDGLTPATEYRYALIHTGLLGRGHRVGQAVARTAKLPGQAFKFIAFGDSGGGTNSQIGLANLMARRDADLIIHTGDLIYMDGEYEHYVDKFFRPYERLIRQIPFYPSQGNHDWRTDDGEPMLRTFVLPRNGPADVQPERCYWFERADARFVAIDSNLDSDCLEHKVAPWLEQVLADSKTIWNFAFFHHPPYTAGKHPPDQRIQQVLVPSLERGGADLVFCGHNHLYERTKPIRAGRTVAEGRGVVYITTGASGMSKYAEKLPPPDYMAAYYDSGFSFTLVEIDGPRLHLRQINDLDRTVDEWEYEKAPPVTATRIASPGTRGE